MNFTKTPSFKTWGIAAAMLLACAGASAQTIELTKTGQLGANITVNDYIGGATAPNSAWSGQVQINDGSSTFWAYCIDPRTGTKWYDAATSTTVNANIYASASLSSFLNTKLSNTNPNSTAYQQQMSGAGYTGLAYAIQDTTLVQNSLESLFSRAYTDSQSSATKAAAFGYAIWEIMGQATYGRITDALRSGGGDTNMGNSSTDAIEKQMDAYLTALTNNSWASVNGANLTTATNYVYTVYYDPATHTAQNFIKVTPGGTSVPEPATLALVGAALLGITSTRRRAAARS